MLLADTSFDHNFSQGLDLQQIYGGGHGLDGVVKTAKQTLDHQGRRALRGGRPTSRLALRARRRRRPSISLFGSTFSEAYTRTLPRKIVFTETGNYIAAWTDTRAYSRPMPTAGLLAIPVFNRLNASVSVVDNFLNDPAPFYRKNSFQFITRRVATALR